MINSRTLRRQSTPGIDALTILSSIYWGLLPHTVCFQRSHVSMYKGHLIHSLRYSLGTGALIISSLIYWEPLLHIAYFQRSRVSIYKGVSTHSPLCSKFVELTLIMSKYDNIFMPFYCYNPICYYLCVQIMTILFKKSFGLKLISVVYEKERSKHTNIES